PERVRLVLDVLGRVQREPARRYELGGIGATVGSRLLAAAVRIDRDDVRRIPRPRARYPQRERVRPARGVGDRLRGEPERRPTREPRGPRDADLRADRERAAALVRARAVRLDAPADRDGGLELDLTEPAVGGQLEWCKLCRDQVLARGR